MSGERPLEMDALVPKLHELFDGRLPKHGGTEQDERDFLSRALAAFCIHHMAGASLEEAANSVVDGGADGGVDAIFTDERASRIWLVQSKYIDDGRSVPPLKDTTRFVSGVEDLLSGQYAEMGKNAAIAAKRPEIERLLRIAGMRVEAVLCYSGIQIVDQDRLHRFEMSRSKFAGFGEDLLAYDTANLTRLASWLNGADADAGVNIPDFRLVSPGEMGTPYHMIFGLVSLVDLSALYQEHGEKLLAANLRGYKGRTDVNEEIAKTATDSPELFAHLNNGLTAYCSQFRVIPAYLNNRAEKRFVLTGLRLINGAQTIGSVAKAFRERAPDAPAPPGHALIKIISLERCDDELEYAKRISHAANFQNSVKTLDFASAYPLHRIWSETLGLVGVGYHYRIDDETPDDDELNFKIEEALTAAACLNNEKSCDFVTRVASNRDSLRSLEAVYPPEQHPNHRHGRVFPEMMTARTLWRAVQVQRVAAEVFRLQVQSSSGVEKAFWIHGRWLILAAIYNRLKVQTHATDLKLSAAEATSVSDAALSFGEKLLAIAIAKGYARREAMAGGQSVLKTERSFQSIFKTQTDCKILFDALKAELWTPAADGQAA
jgi:hypothetical protein